MMQLSFPTWGNCGDQHNWSAMDKPRSGETTFVTMASPLLGKILWDSVSPCGAVEGALTRYPLLLQSEKDSLYYSPLKAAWFCLSCLGLELIFECDVRKDPVSFLSI